MSLATWAALPTSVWMRMYAAITGIDLPDSCRPRGPGHGGRVPERSCLRAEGALSTIGPRTCPRMLRITWHGPEEASDPETLALQGSQGDRCCRAAGRWAGGAHASGHLKVIGPAGSAIVA